jgi:hypothetical protein
VDSEEVTAQKEVPPPPPPQTAAPPPPGGKGSRINLILTIVIALQVIVIIVLTLFLTVWSQEEQAATDEVQIDDRVALVQVYIQAIEDEDVDAYLSCFEPGFYQSEEMMEELGDIDMELTLEEAFSTSDITFKDVEMEATSISDIEAEVETSGGVVEIAFEGDTIELDFSEDPVTFKMKRENGTWYLTEDIAIEVVLGLGLVELE